MPDTGAFLWNYPMFSIKIESAPYPQLQRIESGYNQHQGWWWTSLRLGKRLMSHCLVIRRDFEVMWGWNWFPGIRAIYLGILWVELLQSSDSCAICGSPIITWCGKRIWG